MTEDATTPRVPEETQFEDMLKRLEDIAQKLEAGDTGLEAALALFEEGVGLSKVAAKRLDDAERRLEILLDDDRVEPFDPEHQADSAGN